MEWLRSIPWNSDEAALAELLDLDSLPRLCASIDKLLEQQGDQGRIYCLWGEFAVERQVIRGGVRFSLPGCPNALCWSITTDLPPEPDRLVIHCTINRVEHEPDFLESIEEFVSDWEAGLAGLSPGDGR